MNLTLTRSLRVCRLAGAAVYLWHCDRDGSYSPYSQGLENENYFRGVQESDAAGTVTFTTIFPGAYSGRWPHIHFEVYSGVEDATTSGPIVKTSQIALPLAACEQAYRTAGYERSVQNLAGSSLTSDHVFGDDGGVHQLATVTGDASSGFVANLTIGNGLHVRGWRTGRSDGPAPWAAARCAGGPVGRRRWGMDGDPSTFASVCAPRRHPAPQTQESEPACGIDQ